MRTSKEIVRIIDHQLRDATDTINKHIERLKQNPQDAMEWGQRLFTAAGEHWVATQFLRSWDHWSELNPDEPFVDFLEETRARLMKDVVLREVRYPSQSGHFSHNEAARWKAAEAAQLCERMERWIEEIKFSEFQEATEPKIGVRQSSAASAVVFLGEYTLRIRRKTKSSKFFVVLDLEGRQIGRECHSVDHAISTAKHRLVTNEWEKSKAA